MWTSQRPAVGSSDWLGLWWLILLDLWKEVLADDSAKRDVGDRNGDDETNDLENTCHLLKRHPASSQKRGNETANDNPDNSTANRGDKEEEKPSFEILKFSEFFHTWRDIDLTS